LILAKYLVQYWNGSGLATEGLRWLKVALECLPPPAPEGSGIDQGQPTRQRQAIQAYLLCGATSLAINIGENHTALQYGEEAERWALASGDLHALCDALAMKALAMSLSGEFLPSARTVAEESLELANQFGDVWMQCEILSILTNISHRLGDRAATRNFQQEHSRLARRLGNPWAIGMSVYGLFDIDTEPGYLPEIRREMEEGIRLFARLKNNVFITALRSELAHILRRQGELDEAQSIYMETIPQWLELGHQAAIAHQFECLAALAVVRLQPERAARLLGAAEALRSRLNSEMAPNERTDYGATLAGLRLRLDPADLQSAWSAGEAMVLEQAVAYALGKNGDGALPEMNTSRSLIAS